jgi:4-aminobutyrate aminotransferase/(S)-3-amino-2-methylpropionate transaminase
MFRSSALPESPSIVSAKEDLLYTSDGQVLVDLFTAHGTVWLGHRHPEVQQAIAAQLDRVWITGGIPTPAVEGMRQRLAGFLPPGFALGSLASTGMEANEQALRIARVNTGRNGALGLAGAMHGKSFATAFLAWDNGDGLALPDFYRIPAGAGQDEAAMLDAIEGCLRAGRVAALYIEPIHGTSMGWEASPAFYQSVRALATRYGSLLVYDEVLTGFHRTGERFRFLKHGVEPDLIVFGKACGNGFPVAGIAARKDLALSPRMLLGSTFSNNALAAAAVDATVACLEKLEPPVLVAAIEATVRHHLHGLLGGEQPRMRGSGALWVIALDTAEQATACVQALRRLGVCVGFHGRQLRLLPPLTIRPEHLEQACRAIAATLSAQLPEAF